MAGSVNKVILIGNLGADPEVRSFQNGGRIASLRIATSESWKDRATGERKERTEWHSITIAGDGLVGVAERFLRKGSKIYVEGQLRTRKWQDQNGNDRYSTEVNVGGMHGVLTMLDGAQGSGSQGGGDRGDWGNSNDRGGQRRNDNWGNDRGASGREPEGGRGGGGWGSGANNTFATDYPDDLDDDIPF